MFHSAIQHIHSGKLMTGIRELDKILGGIQSNGIVEVNGESGSGKTQFCLQLSINVAKEFYMEIKAYVLYICTEDVFPSKRFHQMLMHHQDTADIGSHIFIEHVEDVNSLMTLFEKIAPQLHLIKLIIIDSVAGMLRGSYYGYDLSANNRIVKLRALGRILLELNVSHGIAVCCANQVTSCLETNQLIPALGLGWSNLVNHRIQLQRIPGGITRQMKFVSSSSTLCVAFNFRITEKGIE